MTTKNKRCVVNLQLVYLEPNGGAGFCLLCFVTPAGRPGQGSAHKEPVLSLHACFRSLREPTEISSAGSIPLPASQQYSFDSY